MSVAKIENGKMDEWQYTKREDKKWVHSQKSGLLRIKYGGIDRNGLDMHHRRIRKTDRMIVNAAMRTKGGQNKLRWMQWRKIC